MSRRTKSPHCFYCGAPTDGGTSRMDDETPVCTECATVEAFDPQAAIDRWMALGGDRRACMRFVGCLNAARLRRHALRNAPVAGGAR